MYDEADSHCIKPPSVVARALLLDRQRPRFDSFLFLQGSRGGGWILEAATLNEKGSAHPSATNLVKYANLPAPKLSSHMHGKLKSWWSRGMNGRLKADGCVVHSNLGAKPYGGCHTSRGLQFNNHAELGAVAYSYLAVILDRTVLPVHS